MPSLNQLIGIIDILPVELFIVMLTLGFLFTIAKILEHYRYQKEFKNLPEFMRPTKSYWRNNM
ncbi:hypothetical protein BSK66_27815 [Paenibacillus odorifer]|nr:hypothetical protein C171_11616 [Paenibacillus sp. FSL H8-237]OMD13765.1 hypothetical protein BJP47_24365 [Paenibacillus odorifer]OME48995.1 hypothetical protein BSK66_27815 [Paenibacillus odorifer]